MIYFYPIFAKRTFYDTKISVSENIAGGCLNAQQKQQSLIYLHKFNWFIVVKKK